MNFLFLAELTVPRWALTGTAVVTLLQWGLVPHLLAQRNKSPNATLAWLWAILLFPILGGLAYFLLGSERVYRRRLRLVHDLESRAGPHGTPVACRHFCQVPELERINGFPPTGGNHAELLADGMAFFPELLRTIGTAKHHLHLEFYIWNTDRTGRAVRDALVEAAVRGVEVRVLVDEMGSLMLRRSFFRKLEKAGGKFSWFNTFSPLRGRLHLNLRNHRKLVIADGLVALTGGTNIGNEYWTGDKGAAPYRDIQLRLTGPVVTQLAEVFAEDWYFASGEALLSPECYYPESPVVAEVETQVIPGGPDNDLNEIQLSVLAMLHYTQHRLRLMTPYFVPEDAVLSAIQLAAMRGVAIELMVPARGDHLYLTHVTRSYYEDLLLPHGVRIFEYQPSLLHAKVGIIDEHSAMCGSANLDVRSLRINFELNVALYSPELAESLHRLFEANLADCREVTEASHAARPFHHRLLEVVCRPLTSLL